MLHKRYASPFSLLDNYIENEQFNEFIEQLMNKAAEERNDTLLWEFYLHKVEDKSFVEFKAEIKKNERTTDVMDEAKKEIIVKKSQDILNGFRIKTP